MADHDPHHIHVLGGQCVVSSKPDTVLITVLGSCVSACIYDPVAGIGGMNHFILPTGGHQAACENQNRYGDVAMPTLIHGLVRLGAQRERLVAKLYGGRARREEGLDPGAANAAFARRYLQAEGIKILDARLGDDMARWVTFDTATGCSKVREAEDPRLTAISMPPQPKMAPSHPSLTH